MIELPEAVIISRQLNSELRGEQIISGNAGNSPHKWVFYKPSREDIEKKLPHKIINNVNAMGRGIRFIFEDKFVLSINDFGGRISYHNAEKQLPKKYHLYLQFDDNSFLTVSIQGWGFFEILAESQRSDYDIPRSAAISPTDNTFTIDRFSELFDRYEGGDSIKTFFTNGKNIAGIGNGYLQDILFRAKINPRRKVTQISSEEVAPLYRSVKETIEEAIRLNGRECERDIYGNPGMYTPIMDRNATNRPCPDCGTIIKKISYLGGSCYICPSCQV